MRDFLRRVCLRLVSEAGSSAGASSWEGSVLSRRLYPPGARLLPTCDRMVLAWQRSFTLGGQPLVTGLGRKLPPWPPARAS
jgi:hypothetical protein